MIRAIVDNINTHLKYSFKDSLFGVVYPVLNKNQWIPGDRTGKGYMDAVPNQAKISIAYWEDWGTVTLLSTPRYRRMQASLRLILWMNMKKMPSHSYDQAVREFLAYVPKKVGNDVLIRRTGQLAKSTEIFARYDYRDAKQYVAPPFDVAAFTFDIKYMDTDCIPNI